MKASLRALLRGVIDYAGLFPPAKLPLDEAIRNYARYRTEPDSWMLGRFICPAARLAELAPFADLFRSVPPFVFSALGRGGNTTAEFLANLRADAEEIEAFRAQHGERVAVDVFEVRLPNDLLAHSQPAAVGGCFRLVDEIVGRRGLAVFCEAGFVRSEPDRLRTLMGSLPGGFKLRCGGLEPSAFPTPQQVASVLAACRDAGRPLKATAGLHHPLRHLDRALGVSMHGFLNVFGAGVLAATLNLSEDQIRPIIEDENPGHFVFTDAEFRWQDHAAPLDAITRARAEGVVSFGSCSFDEPRDDLRALGLL